MQTQGFGVGIYAPEDVGRIVGLSPSRVERWFRGHDARGDQLVVHPLIEGDWPAVDGEVTLSFMDMIEARFVKVFLEAGISIHLIRSAAHEGARLFQTRHPFCVKRFETDGVSLFVRVHEDGKERLIDVPHRQEAIVQVMNPLLRQLDYDASGIARRWWPLGKEQPVVLDPERSFGEPIVMKRGVPTRSLAGPVLAGDDPQKVARWFRVDLREVQAAVEFERHLQAAA
jgi:uncharacterized protein (DUF433 family)